MASAALGLLGARPAETEPAVLPPYYAERFEEVQIPR
jgi:hypothetical protein